MGKNKQTNNECKTKITDFYGTKNEWVKAELDLKMSDIFGFDNASSEIAVVAEDERGLYITGKSFIGAPLLDPYRMYKRVVPETITTEDNKITYKVNF